MVFELAVKLVKKCWTEEQVCLFFRSLLSVMHIDDQEIVINDLMETYLDNKMRVEKENKALVENVIKQNTTNEKVAYVKFKVCA